MQTPTLQQARKNNKALVIYKSHYTKLHLILMSRSSDILATVAATIHDRTCYYLQNVELGKSFFLIRNYYRMKGAK